MLPGCRSPCVKLSSNNILMNVEHPTWAMYLRLSCDKNEEIIKFLSSSPIQLLAINGDNDDDDDDDDVVGDDDEEDIYKS